VVNIMIKYYADLTLEEIQAIQKLLGFVLFHTSPELYSVSGKLERLNNPDNVDYDSVVFYKNDKGGSPSKEYQHNRISIAIK